MPSSENDLIDDVRHRLVRKFAHLAPDQVATAVQLAHARFENSKVQDFVPLLVERRASKQLSELPADVLIASAQPVAIRVRRPEVNAAIRVPCSAS